MSDSEIRNPNSAILSAASFAAKKHRYQKRKGDDAEPYVNHPLDVAATIASVGGCDDPEVLMAALLHDTVEDTETTRAELVEVFGERVASMVMEVTDDKSLPKAERKQHQVEHAPHLSPGARLVKLADKISNIRDVTNNPPAGWPKERKLEYVAWAERVVAGLRGANEPLERLFDETCAKARARFSE